MRRSHGFTLTELAVVFAIVSLLLAAGMYTLSAQTEQRNFEERAGAWKRRASCCSPLPW